MGAKPLNPKQTRFVAEYLIDLNATQAAIRAGYSEKTAAVIGCENLTKPNIAAAIAEGQAKVAGTLGIDAAQIIADLQELSRRAAAENQYSAAIKAKELVGKHAGMFVERRETTVTDKRMVVEAPPVAKDADEWASQHGPH